MERGIFVRLHPTFHLLSFAQLPSPMTHHLLLQTFNSFEEVLRDEIAGQEAGSLTTCCASEWSIFRHRTQTSTSIMACYLSLEPIQIRHSSIRDRGARSLPLSRLLQVRYGFFAAPPSQTGEMEWFIGGVAGELDCRFGFFKQRLYPSQIQLPPNNTSINPALICLWHKRGGRRYCDSSVDFRGKPEGRVGCTCTCTHRPNSGLSTPKTPSSWSGFISCYYIGA